MAVSGNRVNGLFVANDYPVFLPLLISKIYMYPLNNTFYLRFPFREILWMFHHISGAGHGVYLCLAPLAYIFKEWPPLIILNRIFCKPGQYFTGGRFIFSHLASM